MNRRSPTVIAAEKKIQAKDLPPAVQHAVQAEIRGAIINGYALGKVI